MVAGHIEERHLQLLDETVEFRPLLAAGISIFGTFDEVANRHDKLGLKQIELLDSARKNASTVATRPVGNDGELELPGSHVGLERRPRIFLLGCDIEAFFKGGRGTRIGNAAGKHQCGDHTECDKRHKGKPVHEKLQKGVEIASDCYLLGAFNTGQERSGDPHQNFLRDRMNCLHYDGMDAKEEYQIWAGCSTNESASGQVCT